MRNAKHAAPDTFPLKNAAERLESACMEVAIRVRLLEARRLDGTLDDESRAQALKEVRQMTEEVMERRMIYTQMLQQTCCDSDASGDLLNEVAQV